jgi:outer membrane lipoprotein SlyB
MKKASVNILCVVLLLGMLVVEGCATKAQTGAATGAVLGGATGALLGKGKGAAIGAGAGAVGGYLIGNEMDKQDMKQDQAVIREEANSAVVNVQNSNGSSTPVRMRRVGSRWIGPNGEEYMSLPSSEQLRPVYGF